MKKLKKQIASILILVLLVLNSNIDIVHAGRCVGLQARIEAAQRAAQDARDSLIRARSELRVAKANIRTLKADRRVIRVRIIRDNAILASLLGAAALIGRQIWALRLLIAELWALIRTGGLTPERIQGILYRIAELYQRIQPLLERLQDITQFITETRARLVRHYEDLGRVNAQLAYWEGLLPNLRYWANEYWPRVLRERVAELRRLRSLRCFDNA